MRGLAFFGAALLAVVLYATPARADGLEQGRLIDNLVYHANAVRNAAESDNYREVHWRHGHGAGYQGGYGWGYPRYYSYYGYSPYRTYSYSPYRHYSGYTPYYSYYGPYNYYSGYGSYYSPGWTYWRY